MRVGVFALLLLILIQACGQEPIVDTCECGYYTTQSGKLLHWPDGTRVQFEVHESVPEEQREIIAAAGNSYSYLLKNTKIDVNSKQALAPASRSAAVEDVSGDRVNGIYWVNDKWPWAGTQDGAADAMTLLRFSKSNGIKEVDIFFRADSFAAKTRIAARTLLDTSLFMQLIPEKEENVQAQWIYIIGVHEFGHALGLVHTEKDSVMQSRVGLAKINKPFTKNDHEVFSKAYQVIED